MDINPSLYTDIGFDQIRKRLASFAHSEKSRKFLLDIEPSTDVNTINRSHQKSDDLLKSLHAKEKFPIEQFDSMDKIFQALKIEGKSLSSDLFSKLYSILIMSVNCHTFLKHKIKGSWLCELNQFYLNDSGAKKIDSIFDEDWTIKDSASKELKKIRSEKRKVENSLDKVMASCFEKAKRDGILHEENIQLIDNRKVLSVSATHKRKIQGIVYGQSQTGKAVYIEPADVTNIRNELQELHFRETIEINRIQLQLTNEFRPDLDLLIAGFTALVNFDIFAATASLAFELKAVLPKFSNAININNGRNPILLMQDKQVVPLNLKLDPEDNCLLITGPNAGGKTVVLKTIGLFVLMSQSGLHIPAEKISLPLMDSIFSDIGDHQSIENDLSTFSAHLKGIQHILTHSGRQSLVLMDELGTGTDPDAGTALSQAILENLMKKNAWTIATTHLGRLKLWAQEMDGILNSRMLFDQKKLEPQYEIITGKPGSSFALEIAERMGLKNSVLTRSKSLLGNKALRVETLLTELEHERREVTKMKSRMNQQRKYIQEAEEHIKQLQEKAELDYQSAEQKALDEVHELILETRKDTEHLIRQIRTKQADELSVKQARQRLDERLRDIGEKREKGKRKKQKGLQRNQNQRKSYSSIEIKKGMSVEIPQFNSHGIVLQEANKKGSLLVEMNGKQVRLSIGDVLPAAVKKKKTKKTTSVNSFSMAKPSSLQLDIRGKRVDEGITAVTQFLDRAVVSGLNTVNILHGTGTGALQEAVSILLKELSYVENFNFERPEAGGTGITIVNLK